MDDYDPTANPAITARPIKGRGAAENVAHRPGRETRQALDCTAFTPPRVPPASPQLSLF